MLMTAGLGTRLRPFTDLTPKPLLPVMGVPMAQFAMDAAVAAGARKIVANVHHLAPKAVDGLQRLARGGAELVISDESTTLLGSAGGPAKALPLLDGKPFYLLNADVLCAIDLRDLARAHARNRARWGVRMTLAVLPLPPTDAKYASLALDDGTKLITGWNPPATKGGALYVGAAVLEPEAVAGISVTEPSEFVPMMLKPAIEERKAGFFRTSGLWFDVGSPDLWLWTHVSILRGLETGRLPAPWRWRIEMSNRRVGSEFWASVATGFPSRTECVGPGYIDSRGGRVGLRELGPNAVVYGACAEERLSSAISYDGATIRI